MIAKLYEKIGEKDYYYHEDMKKMRYRVWMVWWIGLFIGSLVGVVVGVILAFNS